MTILRGIICIQAKDVKDSSLPMMLDRPVADTGPAKAIVISLNMCVVSFVRLVLIIKHTPLLC